MTRAIVYDRVSVRDDESREEHLTRCRAFCAARGWDVVREETDAASGFSRGVVRPGWERVRSAVEAGEVDAVVVFAVSRAGRNVASLLRFVEDCRDRGVTLASATEPIDSAGPYGQVFVALLGALAEIESGSKRERALVGRATAKRTGAWVGGHRPYGMRKGAHGRLEVVPEEAEHLRVAAELVLGGSSANSAARALNSRGSRTPSGREWASPDVQSALRRPELAPSVLTRRDLGRVGRALARLERGPNRGRYELTGLLWCGRCGGRMKGKPVSGVRRYVCDASGSLHLSIPADRAEVAVVRAAQGWAAAESAAVADPGSAPEALTRELGELEARLEALGDEVESGGLSESAFRGRERRIEARAEELRARIEAAASAGRRGRSHLEWSPERRAAELRAWLETVVLRVVAAPGRAAPEDRISVEPRPGVVPA